MRALTRRQDSLTPRSLTGIDRLFDDFFGPSPLDRMLDDVFGASVGGARANVFETDEGQAIEIEAPGMQKDDFSIQVDRGVLSVSAHAERKTEREGHREFYRRTFTRRFPLPDGVKDSDITARYDAGILRLDVPYDKDGAGKEVRTIDVQ